MPKVPKGKRQRTYRPKTRSGCLTCKIRRVKCDEARPACVRCTSTGRSCDGYSTVPELHSPLSNELSVTGLSVNIHTSPQANHSFAFFVQRTSPQLAGFFGSNFWERLVLQAAYHESAIRNAIVAIGSLHEQLYQTATSEPINAFALEHYNLAIKDLLVPLAQERRRGIDVCLISCMLFTCFENMQGRHASAGGHIRIGVKLLNETINDQGKGILQHQTLGSTRSADSYAPIEDLAQIFTGLDRQVTCTSYLGDKFRLFESSFGDIELNDYPLLFSSVDEAKLIFEYGCGKFMNFVASIQSSNDPDIHMKVQTELDKNIALLSKFLRGLQAFVDSKGPFLTPKDDIASSVLHLHLLMTYINLNLQKLPPGCQVGWEHFVPQVKEIITLSEKIVSFLSSSSDHTTSFCLDMGYIIPLFDLASRCQEPTLRRQAIALLRSTSRQEGLWNSLLVAKAAERIMQIQEEDLRGMNDYIYGPQRSSIQPLFEIDGVGGRLRYARQGLLSDDCDEIVEEIFAW